MPVIAVGCGRQSGTPSRERSRSGLPRGRRAQPGNCAQVCDRGRLWRHCRVLPLEPTAGEFLARTVGRVSTRPGGLPNTADPSVTEAEPRHP
jgi:hypothetical protein